jgi:hypothetical protein
MIAALTLGLVTMFSVLTTPQSPIKIKSCDVAYIDDSTDSGGVMTTSLQFTNGVTLTVANTSAKTVTAFTVAGSYDKFHVKDSWAGKLLPGAQVSVYKHYAQLPYDGSKAKCAITSATYDDGSMWTPAAQ